MISFDSLGDVLLYQDWLVIFKAYFDLLYMVFLNTVEAYLLNILNNDIDICDFDTFYSIF